MLSCTAPATRWTQTCEQMVTLCNQQLANTSDLYSQTKQAHWNVKGIHFEEFHVLFDKMALAIEPYADTIAERVTALGSTALGTTHGGRASELAEFPADVFDGKEMIQLVVERWATYANSVRGAAEQSDEAGDLVTSDMFIEISTLADKMLWFAEAHLQS
ncbi:MAG: DNA starvation/stationary phase protection protein Dps [Caldilineaceae bacterium]